MLKNENHASKLIFVISGNFRYQEIFPFEKRDIRMASRIITKNSAADQEIRNSHADSVGVNKMMFLNLWAKMMFLKIFWAWSLPVFTKNSGKSCYFFLNIGVFVIRVSNN